MEEQNNNISPEQRQSALDQRKQRLQAMGLPEPVIPINPSSVINVKDPGMLKRIQEIRSGNLKQEFRNFENKADGKPVLEEIPVPKPKQKPGSPSQQQNKVHIPLDEFTAKSDPSIDALGQMFNFDNVGRAKSVPEMNQQFNTQVDDAGRGFVSDFKNRMAKTLQEKQVNESSNYQTQSVPQFQSGMIILNEADLKKKIIEVATPLAKQIATDIIKQVLNEYAKTKTITSTNSNKTIVSEKKSNTTEAEILPDGRVRINGKVYKLNVDKK